MKCVKSVLGEFSSGVSICRNNGTQSDLGGPLSARAPLAGGYGSPSSGSGYNWPFTGKHNADMAHSENKFDTPATV